MVTSASAETVVVPLAVSGAAFAPCPVVVEMTLLTVALPPDGALKPIVSVIVDPAPRLAGIPVNVTAPVPEL